MAISGNRFAFAGMLCAAAACISLAPRQRVRRPCGRRSQGRGGQLRHPELSLRLGRNAARAAHALHDPRQARIATRTAASPMRCSSCTAPADRATASWCDRFAGVLFGKGQLLDAGRYYIILPDGIGHGDSSKPSDGLHARFPQYDYEDMVNAQHLLVTQGLQVDHLRLVIGTSMGCMHSWMWAERYPDFVDALMPLACLPVQIAGRNRVWRDLVMDAIRTDPAVAAGRIPHRTGERPAHRRRLAAHRRQRADPDADRPADPRCGR